MDDVMLRGKWEIEKGEGMLRGEQQTCKEHQGWAVGTLTAFEPVAYWQATSIKSESWEVSTVVLNNNGISLSTLLD